MSKGDYPGRILNAGQSTKSNSYGGSDWFDITDALWRYLRRDFSDFDSQMENVYERSHGDIIPRTVPFIYRLARELASFYVRPPARTFVDPDTGERLPDDVVARIARVYRGANINAKMRTAHEHLVAMGNATIWVWPVVTPTMRGVRILQPPPHYQAYTLGDALSHDERDAIEWWVRVPFRRFTATGLMEWSTAYVTPTEATWVDGGEGLAGQGLFAPDGTNPLGRIPVVSLRTSEPGMGEGVFGPAPEDLLDAARAVCFGYTDSGHIARFQGYGQPVISGIPDQAAANINVGPEHVIGIPEDASFSFASPNPDLGGLQSNLDSYLRAIVSSNGLNPDTLLKSSGITALSKLVERSDREVERRRQVETFRRAEQRVYDLIRGWINALTGAEVMPRARVDIEYREPYQPADPLHDAQATKMMIDMNITSAVAEVAKRGGFTQEEARARVIQFRDEQREIGSATTLNGPQVAAALNIADRVASGAITEAGGVAMMVESLGVSEEVALEALSGAKPGAEAEPPLGLVKGGGDG